MFEQELSKPGEKLGKDSGEKSSVEQMDSGDDPMLLLEQVDEKTLLEAFNGKMEQGLSRPEKLGQEKARQNRLAEEARRRGTPR